MMQIRRRLEALARKAGAKRPALMLTGPRQAGKSTALRQAFPDYRYVTLDLPHIAELAEESGVEFLDRYPPPVIIDEVQYAPSLFRYIKAAIDANRDRYSQFLLTGSQQFHLNQSGAESLAGRIGILHLNTLSLYELEQAFGVVAEGEQLLHWILSGGYPEIHANGIESGLFFGGYIPTYLERDIRHVVQVRNARDFTRFLRLLAARTGQLTSYNSIASDLGMSSNTVKTWTEVLEGAGVIRFCEPYFNDFGKRVTKTPKIYFMDTGLACFLLGLHSIQSLRESVLYGHIFETLVYGQMVRSLTDDGEPPEVYFYRDRYGKEVDFVVPNGGKLDMYEVKAGERAPDNLPGMDDFEEAAGAEAGERIVITSLRGSRRLNTRGITVRDCVDPRGNYGRSGAIESPIGVGER